MSSQSFLILSDIHFGGMGFEQAFQKTNHTGLMKARCPVAGIATICEGRDISAIIAPGDLTSRAEATEFIGSKGLLKNLGAALGVSEGSIITTYGNHDVDWRISALSGPDGDPEADKFYRQIARSVGENVGPSLAVPLEKGPVLGSGIYRVGKTQFYVINSGLECYHDQGHRRGKIASEQLAWLENKFAEPLNEELFHVLIVHHHLIPHKYPEALFDYSQLEEAPQVVEAAAKAGVDLVIHGHCHHPRLVTQKQTGWNRAMAVLCCGSVGVANEHRDNGNIPNLFHIVELQERHSNGSCRGRVDTFRYAGSGKWESTEFHERNCPIDPRSCFGISVTQQDAIPVVDQMLDEIRAHGDKEILWEDLPYELQCLDAADATTIIKKRAILKSISVRDKKGENLIFLP
jgi:3',5'-cyclic AMP phosphodiesterase CpdA